jgi:S1-C subfamily serine protease
VLEQSAAAARSTHVKESRQSDGRPQHSPDGRWWWTGTRWVPAARPWQPPPPPTRRIWPAVAWIGLAELALVLACAITVPVSLAFSNRAIEVLTLAVASPLGDLDIAPPPGASAIPQPASSAQAGTGLGTQAIAARVASATVLISATLRHQFSLTQGTGIVLTSSGLVLTDEHVIADAESITAQVGGTGRTYQAALIGADVADDVALLQLEHASALGTATLGRSADAAVGNRVVVLGYPDEGEPAVVAGRLTGLDESIDVPETESERGTSNEPKIGYFGMLHSTAHTRPGQSGGPVLDTSGHVIGMAQVGGSDDFDIPIDRALADAREIAAGHRSADVIIGAPAELGLVMRTWSPTAGSAAGARVLRVYREAAARSLDIQVGDVVTELDGSSIASAAEYRQVLTHYRPGDRIEVTWTDSRGRSHTARTTLTAGAAP